VVLHDADHLEGHGHDGQAREKELAAENDSTLE
jgi:hypothetical protein